MEGQLGIISVLSDSQSKSASPRHRHGLIQHLLGDVFIELAVGAEGIADETSENGTKGPISFLIAGIFFEQLQKFIAFSLICDLLPEAGLNDFVDFFVDLLVGHGRDCFLC